MTQDNDTTGVDATDESVDSPVMKALRQQVKDLTKLVNNAPTRESIEAEIREGLARESAISEHLVALGHPAGMSAILTGQLGDAEVTRESVTEALQGIGYQVVVDDATSEPDGEAPSQQSDLAKVTSLSAQVRTAAQSGAEDDLSKKISQAQTPADLAALMAEAGLSA